MKCSVCEDRLNGTYFTFLDKLICEKDYKVITTLLIITMSSSCQKTFEIFTFT